MSFLEFKSELCSTALFVVLFWDYILFICIGNELRNNLLSDVRLLVLMFLKNNVSEKLNFRYFLKWGEFRTNLNIFFSSVIAAKCSFPLLLTLFQYIIVHEPGEYIVGFFFSFLEQENWICDCFFFILLITVRGIFEELLSRKRIII